MLNDSHAPFLNRLQRLALGMAFAASLGACSAPPEQVRHEVAAVRGAEMTILLIERQVVVLADDGPRIASRTPHATVALLGTEVRLGSPARDGVSFACSRRDGATSEHDLHCGDGALTVDGQSHSLDQGRLLVLNVTEDGALSGRVISLPSDYEEAAFLRRDVMGIEGVVRAALMDGP